MASNAQGKRASKNGNILKVMTNLRITELEREDEAAWDAYVLNSRTSTFYHQQRSVLIKRFKSLMSEHEADITLRWVRDDRSGKKFIHIKNYSFCSAQFPERQGFCRRTVTSPQCICYDTGMQG